MTVGQILELEPCTACMGTGYPQADTKARIDPFDPLSTLCPHCEGAGRVRRADNIKGAFDARETRKANT